jgi:signal transduction histidine kinase
MNMNETTRSRTKKVPATAGKAERRISLSSRGARVQFEIAVALTSVIPLLALAYFATRGFWEEGRGFGMQEMLVALVIVLVALGYGLLVKYPLTVIKLRRYLENMVKGELPSEIRLDDSEDDITSIQRCMNMILEQLRTRVETLEKEQVRLETELCQAQKLQAIGTLAAGIAHEINTPIQFVSDNTKFLSETVLDILGLLDAYRQLRADGECGRMTPETLAEITRMEKAIDLDFVEKEVPAAIAQSLEGLAQAADIARALKDFSRMVHEDEKTDTDINKAVESSVTVSRNEWKYVAEVKTDFDPGLPLISCYPGDIKQVVVNLVVNAAHAIGDAMAQKGSGKGRITITTRHDGEMAVISVADTGTGIPQAIHEKIFEPYFTTKKGGKGTGLGLAIVRSLIVGKHGGALTFKTEEGKGTTFEIRLPLSTADQRIAEESHVNDRSAPAEAHLVC